MITFDLEFPMDLDTGDPCTLSTYIAKRAYDYIREHVENQGYLKSSCRPKIKDFIDKLNSGIHSDISIQYDEYERIVIIQFKYYIIRVTLGSMTATGDQYSISMIFQSLDKDEVESPLMSLSVILDQFIEVINEVNQIIPDIKSRYQQLLQDHQKKLKLINVKFKTIRCMIDDTFRTLNDSVKLEWYEDCNYDEIIAFLKIGDKGWYQWILTDHDINQVLDDLNSIKSFCRSAISNS